MEQTNNEKKETQDASEATTEGQPKELSKNQKKKLEKQKEAEEKCKRVYFLWDDLVLRAASVFYF